MYGQVDGNIFATAARASARRIGGKLAAEGATVVCTGRGERQAAPGGRAARSCLLPSMLTSPTEQAPGAGHGLGSSSAGLTSWSTADKASPFAESDPADWDRAIAVNLYGVLHTCMSGGRAAVVNLGLHRGWVRCPARRSTPVRPGGCVIAFTKSLARSTGTAPVSERLPARCPGRLRCSRRSPGRSCARPTKAIPFRRLGQPGD